MYLYECILTWLGCPLTWFLINYYISLIYHCLLGGSFLTTYYLHDNGQVKQGKRNNDDQVNQWKMQWWGWIVEWCLCTYIAQPIRLWIIYIVPINLLPSSTYAHLVYVYTIMIDGYIINDVIQILLTSHVSKLDKLDENHTRSNCNN